MRPAIKVLPEQTVLVEYGPMRMTVRVLEGERVRADLADEGAHEAIRVLEDLARFQSEIRKKAYAMEVSTAFPDVVRRMVDATRKMGEPDLTPLAAVAGAASDVVADFIFQKGGTKILVENGGDIAIRLVEGEVARVGVKTDVDAKEHAYLMPLEAGAGIGGVATSGLGGRSFTKGIASAVTVFAATASLSDAAATVIGNATHVDDPAIIRMPAEKLYPETDLPGEFVTFRVGDLSEARIEEALQNGMSKAEELFRKGLIAGALLALRGRIVVTDFVRPRLVSLKGQPLS
jgi:uncharacterized protein